MIEKHYLLEEADPAVFFGVNNANLRLLRALYPKMRIIGRDNVIKAMGGEEDMASFEETFNTLQKHCAKYNLLSEEDVVNIVKRIMSMMKRRAMLLFTAPAASPLRREAKISAAW